MVAKQSLQELELFYKRGPSLLSIAPRWHAITHTAHAGRLCPLFCRLILNLTFFFAGSSRPAEFLVLADTHTSVSLLPLCTSGLPRDVFIKIDTQIV